MKTFIKFNFNPKLCGKELAEFKKLLDSSSILDERKDILPFFRHRKHLSAFNGMLILGRSGDLEYKEQMRLQWRLDKVLVDSKQIFCITFDDLYKDLKSRLSNYGPLAYLADKED